MTKTKGKKPIVGILGGICSGKSTVAAQLGRLGCAVIDADKIAKELLDEPTIQPEIVKLFGNAILNSENKVDRRKLANIVFSDPAQLSALTSIIHPPVLEKTNTLIEAYMGDDAVEVIVLDVPLLAEVGWEKECDKLIFVDCDLQIRLERAKNRGFGTENELKMRENFQISLDKKAQMSDYRVHNNSDMSELALQVSRVFNCIVNDA
jgi:dephospho-CoA kinase